MSAKIIKFVTEIGRGFAQFVRCRKMNRNNFQVRRAEKRSAFRRMNPIRRITLRLIPCGG